MDVSQPSPIHYALRSTARSTSSANHPSPSTSSGQEVKTAKAEAKKAVDAEVAETKKAAPKGAKVSAAAEAVTIITYIVHSGGRRRIDTIDHVNLSSK